ILSAWQTKQLQQLKANKVLSWKDRKSCLPDDLSVVPQRLMDWFHLLKSQSKKKFNHEEHYIDYGEQVGCSSPVLTWFFQTFDSNKDMALDEGELSE
ncbi:hypothetical protein, partial [Salmonella sp. s54412]|uniref:hypothetical protein n=1 Tax=Salmonella sp. s54412 TaxID=3160128 RepID=UPI0037550116